MYFLCGIITLLSAVIIRSVSVGPVKDLFLDTPDQRKVHQRLVPRVGGLAVLFTLICFLPFFYQTPIDSKLFIPFALSIGFGLLVAFLDDSTLIQQYQIKHKGKATWEFSPKHKLLLEFALAGFLVYFLDLKFPLTHDWFPILSPLFGIIWIAGVTNAANLIDGIDGLAGGVTSIILGAIAIVAAWVGNESVLILSALILAANIGFLINNFSPARVFFGDAGSLFTGFSIGYLSLLLFNSPPLHENLVSMFLIVGYPIMEVAVSMYRRFLLQVPANATFKQRLKNMVSPDNNHLHHRLLFKGLSHRQACGVLYSLAAFMSLSGVLMFQLSEILKLVLIHWFVIGVAWVLKNIYRASANYNNFNIKRYNRSDYKAYSIGVVGRQDQILLYSLINSRGHHFDFEFISRDDSLMQVTNHSVMIIEQDIYETPEHFITSFQKLISSGCALILIVENQDMIKAIHDKFDQYSYNYQCFTRPAYAIRIIQTLHELTLKSVRTKTDEMREILLSKAERL